MIMKKQILKTTIHISALFIILFSCRKETFTPDNKQTENPESSSKENFFGEKSKKVYVTNITELYTAVNDVQNAGACIVLKPGTYSLNTSFPNSGRLELLHDMSLRGQLGKPEAVVIDVSSLPSTSYVLGPGRRTGAIRTGDGYNEIEWLTIQNTAGISNNIRSLIQTDIAVTSFTRIKLAHCILKGSSIGLNIINREAVNNGRTVEAEIRMNEFLDNNVLQFGSGIQFQNSNGISNAIIRGTMIGNKIYGNKAGILAFNASSTNSVIEINSYVDKIEKNGMGLMFNGGFCESAANPTVGNSLKFKAYASAIRENTGNPSAPFLFPATGVWLAAGEAFPPFALPGTAQNNELEASFTACIIKDNYGNSQINAFGGHSFHPSSTPVGTNNSTKIYLRGINRGVTISETNSFPVEPAGTNTVTVYR